MLFFPTVDEDFQYFRSQGYAGSINDMHFKAMGDLGYTGSLNDRIHAYLTFKYGSFYEAMRDLRNGTSVFALSSYIINGFDPDLVFDFKKNYYRKSATNSTFAASITHAASSNATMVDSDGLLKWRSHNYARQSQDITQTPWITQVLVGVNATNVTYSGSQGGSPFLQQTIPLANQSIKFTVGVLVSGTGSFRLKSTQGNVIDNFSADIVATGTPTLHEFSVVNTSAAGSGAQLIGIIPSTSNGAFDLTVTNWRTYRSDLGGMVNNSETGDSFVPTTTAAVYGPRVGNHIYNGSAWVNEGILHESEARTNVIQNSNDLTASEWRSVASSNSANAGVSPDGASNANKVVPDNSFNRHFTYLEKTLNGVAGTHSFSVYLAAAGYGFATVCVGSDGALNYYAVVIDLSNGTKTATYSSGTHTEKVCTVEAVGSYLRIKISGAGEIYYIVGASDTGTYTPRTYGFKEFSADGTSGILVYGAQAESGSTPSSYIPTSGATATRAAETLTVPAANLPYSSTNMSIQIDGKMTYADTDGDNGKFFSWNLDNSNNIYSMLSTYQARTGAIYWVQESGNVLDAVTGPNTSYSPDTNVPFNFASRHGSTFLNGAIDGTALTANTTPTALPNLSSTVLNLGYTFMGTIGQFRMWDEDLTDTGIATASAPTFTTEFAMTVATTGTNETFTIPCQNVGTFNAGIDWGDGSVSTVTAYNDAGLTHTYATAGDHLIRITGSFPNIHFNNGGDKLKLKSVHNLGTVGWTRLNNAFWGCSNMTSFTAGTTDTSAVTNMSFMFRDCSSLTSLDLSNFDTSSVVAMNIMFWNCSGLTSLNVSSFNTAAVTNMSFMFYLNSSLSSLDVSSFDTSAVTNMGAMFRACSNLSDIIGVENFNIEGVNSNRTGLNEFMKSVTLNTVRYNALLINWNAQEPFNNMAPDFGNSKYTGGGTAAAARANLISNDGWTITDGGVA